MGLQKVWAGHVEKGWGLNAPLRVSVSLLQSGRFASTARAGSSISGE